MPTQFVSALELATYFNGTTDVADLTPEFIAQADLLLQMISADVEAAAGVTIDAYSRTVLIPGVWGRDLQLPGNVRSISAVALNGQAVSAAGYYDNGRSMLRLGGDGLELDGYDIFYASHQGAATRPGGTWGGPGATVAVELEGGYETVPDFVRSLVLRIAARTFGNVGQVTQESLAIYSVSYGQSTNTNDGSHVTNSERKRLRKMLRSTVGTIVPVGL